MDTTYSSGEDLLIKTRKPYTITKQRERWTEEEHSRFLEALKLYGRAWQRIEEHIGTKTAVQIRSHAQKFFSKLEKEALIKGVPLGQSLDIDIPPPRPKRKPSNPYPRKTSVDAPTSSPVGAKDGKLLESASSVYPDKQMLNLENDPPPEKASGAEKTARAKETLDEDNCSEVLVLFQESPCASISSASKISKPAPAVPTGPCALREFVPSTKEINESCLTVETIGSQKLVGTDAGHTDLDNGISESQNLVQRERTDELKQPMKLGLSTTNEIQANQNYPRHVPVHVVDSSEMCMKTSSPDMTYPASLIHQVGVHRNPNLFTNPTASSTTEDHSNMSRSTIHQSLPSFLPPFNPLCNIQDNYQSFLNASPTFSSLIVSSLLQNPAAHAAACLAASFLPCPNMEISVDSPATIPGGFPLRHMRPSPSMAAIAAATVAAASAWWAAHGLFPLCPPLHTGFTCTPAPSTENPSADAGQAHVINKERKINTQDSPWEDQHPGPEFSEALKTQHSASKSPPLTPSDSEESGGAKSNRNGLKADHNQKPVPVTEFHDSNNTKTRKQVDRSSCGSNTPSSSEVEIEALEKNDEGKEESKEPDVSHPAGEPNNRRIRSSIGNINESWKEVSEGGRLAFQALFSREVLPQSFSPPHDLRNKGHLEHIEEGKQKSDKECDTTLQLDLNCKTWGTWLNLSEVQKNELLRGDNNTDKGLPMTRLGHGKFMACRTGFKPYKRCSVEAKESRVSSGSGQGEEKCPKRIRLEGEASKC